jgi:hypothetical protein
MIQERSKNVTNKGMEGMVGDMEPVSNTGFVEGKEMQPIVYLA